MKRGVAEGHVPEGLKAPLFASSDRRERINPAVAAGFSLSKRLFRQAEAPLKEGGRVGHPFGNAGFAQPAGATPLVYGDH